MTLNIPAFISNAIKTQSLIQHLDVHTKTCSPDDVPESVKKIIKDEFGDKYILDADFISFFWGDIQKDDIKRLFNVVDKALGKSANRLTESDFKRLPIDDSQEEKEEKDLESIEDEEFDDEETSDDVEVEEFDTDEDEDEDTEVEKLNESDESDEDSNDDEDDVDVNDVDIDDIEEDTSDDEDDEDLEDDANDRDAHHDTTYLFLKITLND
jgi:hypothetical protein